MSEKEKEADIRVFTCGCICGLIFALYMMIALSGTW